MKINIQTLILLLVAALFAYLWLSAPKEIVNPFPNQIRIDSLKNEINYYNKVLLSSDSVIIALTGKIDSLNKDRMKLVLQLKKMKGNYENQIKFINNSSIDDNINFFRSKYTQDSTDKK